MIVSPIMNCSSSLNDAWLISKRSECMLQLLLTGPFAMVTIGFGIYGNLKTIYRLQSTTNRLNHRFVASVSCLAVSDSILLFASVLCYMQLPALFSSDNTGLIIYSQLITLTTKTISMWLVTFIGIQRYHAVSRPFQTLSSANFVNYQNHHFNHQHYYTPVLIAIVAIIINSPIYYYFSIRNQNLQTLYNNGLWFDPPINYHTHFDIIYRLLIKTLLETLAPCIVTIALSVTVRVRLARMNRTRRRLMVRPSILIKNSGDSDTISIAGFGDNRTGHHRLLRSTPSSTVLLMLRDYRLTLIAMKMLLLRVIPYVCCLLVEYRHGTGGGSRLIIDYFLLVDSSTNWLFYYVTSSTNNNADTSSHGVGCAMSPMTPDLSRRRSTIAAGSRATPVSMRRSSNNGDGLSPMSVVRHSSASPSPTSWTPVSIRRND